MPAETFWRMGIIYLLLPHNGAVAQSVEQRTENPCVAGSIPAHTTKMRAGAQCESDATRSHFSLTPALFLALKIEVVQ